MKFKTVWNRIAQGFNSTCGAGMVGGAGYLLGTGQTGFAIAYAAIGSMFGFLAVEKNVEAHQAKNEHYKNARAIENNLEGLVDTDTHRALRTFTEAVEVQSNFGPIELYRTTDNHFYVQSATALEAYKELPKADKKAAKKIARELDIKFKKAYEDDHWVFRSEIVQGTEDELFSLTHNIVLANGLFSGYRMGARDDAKLTPAVKKAFKEKHRDVQTFYTA